MQVEVEEKVDTNLLSPTYRKDKAPTLHELIADLHNSVEQSLDPKKFFTRKF